MPIEQSNSGAVPATGFEPFFARSPWGLSCLVILAVLVAMGCDQGGAAFPDKAPLPVTVMRLTESSPAASRLYSGSVRSWKSEDLTFEVDGRLKWVLEPGVTVQGRSFKADGSVLSPGTQIAQLDDERFVSAVESAKSKVQIERFRRDGLIIQMESSLPAELASAEAQFELAKTDLDRNERLVQQNAGSGRDLDKARADFSAAKAKIAELKAQVLRVQAEVQSSEAAIEQAIQIQKDAERDLRNTRLYSAFAGQIADTQVVPGSLAGPNSTVATVQMTNPIKVEIEVSAEVSRKLLPGEDLKLRMVTGDGQTRQVEANVYTIAPSADNATRTFTITLLVVNERIRPKMPEGKTASEVPEASNVWRVNLGILPDIPEGTYYMPVEGIRSDSRGSFVWRVTNFGHGDPTQEVMRVEKLYVSPGEAQVPLLGKTFFQTVTIPDGQDFHPEKDLFAVGLAIDGEPVPQWDGDLVVFSRGERWLLRPGDLVQVDLSRDSAPRGIYVPVTAIHEDAGKTYVYVVEAGVARQVEIRTGNVVGQSQHQIAPSEESDDLLDKLIVVEGVHYLFDGQTVAITGGPDTDSASDAAEERP